jgi:hypothetical protein
MNFQSVADSFIRSGGAPLISQNGVSYPGMINKEGTEIKFQSNVYPAPGDILSLLGFEHYLVLDVFPKLNAETVATVCRVRIQANFSRYPATSKDSFGRDTSTCTVYLEDHFIYTRNAGEGQLDALVPRWYGVQLQDMVTFEDTSYNVRSISKNGGVCQLSLFEAS